MGILSGLLGNAAEIDVADVEQELASILAEGEKLEQVFKIIRDLIVFTNKRLIFIDKQGLTGSKKEYMSVPYRSVVRFAAETKGHFDLESDLKIWLSSTEQPISKTFNKDGNIMAVQKHWPLMCAAKLWHCCITNNNAWALLDNSTELSA